MTTATLIKKTFNWGWFTVQRFSPLSCRKHGGTQADMVLEEELKVLHLDPQAAGRDSEPLGLV